MWVESAWLWQTSIRSRPVAVLRFTRPHVALLAGMYTVLGAGLASSNWFHHTGDVLRGALAIGLVVAFGFIINDYHDADLDGISKPYRAIPAGVLSAPFALLLACLSAGAAILVAAGIGAWAATVALALVLLSAAYSYLLKTTLFLGIGTVAVLNVSTVLYGCMAVGAVSPAALMLAVFAFLNAGAQETLYNLVDRKEDAPAAVMTTAVRLGPQKTLVLFAGLTVACTLAMLVPWIVGLGSPLYIWTALPCSAIPLLGIVLFVVIERTQESYCRAHRMMKLVRLSSVIPVLLLR